jgi:transcriptional regulator with XRE-family HTH domain
MPQVSFGTRLRALRKERGLTQEELANQTGLSKNGISMIERDENSPSVATLKTLATALKIKVSYFFEDDQQTNVIHLKVTDNSPSLTKNGLTIRKLGHRLKGQQIEPCLVNLEAHSKNDEPIAVHSGHEFVYCLRGTVEYEVDNNVYLLEPGDVLLFEATLPHRWRNPTSEKAEILLILQTPDEETHESIRRHFAGYPSLPHLE